MINGMTLIAKLSPMKRILCVCPVLQSHHPRQQTRRGIGDNDTEMNEKTELKLKIGFAISDPYLSYASPMAEEICVTLKETWKTTTDDNLRPTKEQQQRIWAKNEIPTTNVDFYRKFDHGDIGAILGALPMSDTRNTKQNDRDIHSNRNRDHTFTIKSIRESLLQYMQQTENNHLTLGNNANKTDTILFGVMDDRLTLQEVQQMALDTPHMWEDTDLLLGDVMETTLCSAKMPSSFHACVALNNFLYQHVGGWPNTFG